MTLDIVILLGAAAFAVLGWLSGAIFQTFRILAIAAAFVLARLIAMSFAEAIGATLRVGPAIPALVLTVTLSIVLYIGIWFALKLIATLLKGDRDPGGVDGYAGAAMSVAKYLVIAFLAVCGLHAWGGDKPGGALGTISEGSVAYSFAMDNNLLLRLTIPRAREALEAAAGVRRVVLARGGAGGAEGPRVRVISGGGGSRGGHTNLNLSARPHDGEAGAGGAGSPGRRDGLGGLLGLGGAASDTPQAEALAQTDTRGGAGWGGGNRGLFDELKSPEAAQTFTAAAGDGQEKVNALLQSGQVQKAAEHGNLLGLLATPEFAAVMADPNAMAALMAVGAQATSAAQPRLDQALNGR